MLRRSSAAHSLRAAAAWLLPAVALLCSLSTVSCKRVEKEVHAAPQPRIHVATIEVGTQRVQTTSPVTGTVRAIVQTELAANATGKVLEVFVQRGDEVKKGTIIAKLDVRLVGLQAAAAKAQSQVATEQAAVQATECARLEKLAAAGAIPLADYEKQAGMCKVSQSSVTVSQLNAAVAQQAITDGLIRAPFDGYIDERFVESGQYVMPNTKVATMVALDTLKVEISVAEMQIGKIQKDLEITFHVGPFPDRVFTAKIVRVSPVVRPATRDVLAEAEVKNADRALRPGMFATVDLPLGEQEMAVVPATAITTTDGSSHVFVVSGGRIEERAVQLGAKLGEQIAIVKGVIEGERLVSGPTPEVKNGLLADTETTAPNKTL